MKSLSTFIFLLLLFITQASAQSALKKVEKFLQHDEHIKQIWPGFIKKYHHSIYSSDGTVYLALDEKQLPDWQKVKVVNNTPIWVKKDKKFTQFSGLFFTKYPLTNDLTIDGAFSDDDAIYTLFHESFHAFQDTLVRPSMSWQNIKISDYMIEIKRKEFAVLYKLMEHKFNDINEENKNIVLYISIRKYRESLMDDNAIALERAMEWQEGVAAYIEYKIKDIMKKSSFAYQLNKFGLGSTNNDHFNRLENFMRWKAYYHGAAICDILEKYHPQWKAQIELGKTPFELLEGLYSAVDLNDDDIEKLLRVNKNNHSQTVEQQTFNQHKTWKTTLQFRSTSQSMTYQPQKLTSYNNGILAESIQKLQFEDDFLTISGRPKLLFMPFEQKQGFGYYYIKIRKMPKKPKMCNPITESQWQCKAGTKLKVAGVKIKMKTEAIIHISEDGIKLF